MISSEQIINNSDHNQTVPDFNGIEDRNAWLKNVFDNDPKYLGKSLPEVALKQLTAEELLNLENVRTGDSKIPSTGFSIYEPHNGRIGVVVLNNPEREYWGSDKLYIADLQINKGARGKGFGAATYLAILQALPAKKGLRTEGVLSHDAVRMWEGLVDKGVAKYVGSPDDAPRAYETVF